MARALRADYFPLGLVFDDVPGTVRLSRSLSETEIDSWRLDYVEGLKALVAADLLGRMRWRS